MWREGIVKFLTEYREMQGEPAVTHFVHELTGIGLHDRKESSPPPIALHQMQNVWGLHPP